MHNERYDLEGILPVGLQGPLEEIYLEEVITQLGKDRNKECGPDCLSIELSKALRDEGALWMIGVLNESKAQ